MLCGLNILPPQVWGQRSRNIGGEQRTLDCEPGDLPLPSGASDFFFFFFFNEQVVTVCVWSDSSPMFPLLRVPLFPPVSLLPQAIHAHLPDFIHCRTKLLPLTLYFIITAVCSSPAKEDFRLGGNYYYYTQGNPQFNALIYSG